MTADKIFFIKRNKLIIAAAVVLTALFLLPLRQARINPDLMEYLPDDIESRISLDSIEAIFGHYDPVMLIMESDDILDESTLTRMRDLNRLFIAAPEFDDVISLFEVKYIRGEHGAMLIDPVVRSIPSSENQRESLRREITANPFAWKLLVSEDFRYSLILLNPAEDISDSEIFEVINRVLNEVPGDEKIWMGGLPFLRYEIQKSAIRDLAVLFPAGLVLMILFLYFSFREIKCVLLPLSVVCMSIVLAMGLMPLMGWDFSLIAVLVPIMMIAIANNYGVHIVARYQELNAGNPDLTMKEMVNRSMAALGKPVILTALTTVFGILGMAAHIMLPARQMGIVSAAGIAFALILSLFFVPALLSGLEKGAVQKSFTEKRDQVVDRFLSWAGKAATGKPVITGFVFLVFMIIAAAGIPRLKVSINMEEMMPASNQMRISTGIANNHFGGTKHVSILFEGDVRDPGLMTGMDKFGKDLRAVDGIGSVTSLATVIREISRSLNDPEDPYYDTIPDNRAAIAQYLELYSMSGDPEDLEKLVDFDFTRALLNVQFRAKDIREFRRITSHIEEMVGNSSWAVLLAGQSLIEKEMSQMIVRGQIRSLIFALLAIAILLSLIFRSLYAGLMGGIPLFFTLICNFGLMGWAGFDLDIGTSLLSSIAIGIGVDYTIHLFWRLKSELSTGREFKEAVILSLSTTGRGITINAFSVIIGFSVLFLSALVILKTFAFLIIFSLFLCLFCALLLVPALSMIIRPEFLKNRKL